MGVLTRDGTGTTTQLRARREVIVCCGAIDSPETAAAVGDWSVARPAGAGVDVVVDLPGVGENLMDHAEGLIVWETDRVVPDTCATGWDAGAAVRPDATTGRRARTY